MMMVIYLASGGLLGRGRLYQLHWTRVFLRQISKDHRGLHNITMTFHLDIIYISKEFGEDFFVVLNQTAMHNPSSMCVLLNTNDNVTAISYAEVS